MSLPAFRICLALAAALVAVNAGAALNANSRFTLRELQDAPELSPKQFADLFGNFRYTYCPYVQPVDTFLGGQNGDCDDYALLADFILTQRGLHTRFIQVVMVGQEISHAICYVTEKKVYLDYNNRKYYVNLERAGPTLRQIAAKVADSFEKNWTTATEYTFTYTSNRKVPRFTVVKTDRPDTDPDRAAKP